MEEHDEKVEIGGIRFVYNSGLAPYMEGLRISYSNSWLGRGFQVHREGFQGNC
ncbi:hypothetical protein [Effusibacillus lacus]|nr:hypothetical protein [Effusibacillus lacus]TCS71213.1 hypothetical protein EDD64_12712 [Effusibacillus lacus]